jgi:chromosome segregation ATPase
MREEAKSAKVEATAKIKEAEASKAACDTKIEQTKSLWDSYQQQKDDIMESKETFLKASEGKLLEYQNAILKLEAMTSDAESLRGSYQQQKDHLLNSKESLLKRYENKLAECHKALQDLESKVSDAESTKSQGQEEYNKLDVLRVTLEGELAESGSGRQKTDADRVTLELDQKVLESDGMNLGAGSKSVDTLLATKSDELDVAKRETNAYENKLRDISLHPCVPDSVSQYLDLFVLC